MSLESGEPMAFGVVLCADDYALSPAVSCGIREALAAGRLTATSCMANQSFWPGEAGALRRFAAHADIGLHFNLTLGQPLTAMPLLAPSGIFPSIAALMKASRGKTLPLAEIRAEAGAQLDAFEAHFGSPPDFLDGHQHVHILPGIAETVLGELARRRLAKGFWLRNSADRIARILVRRSAVPKALALAWLGWDFAKAARARGFACNEGFAGFSAFRPGQDYAKQFARFLEAPGVRHLVMCHPGHVDAQLMALDPVVATREQELAFLLSPKFPAVLAAGGARLVRGFGK